MKLCLSCEREAAVLAGRCEECHAELAYFTPLALAGQGIEQDIANEKRMRDHNRAFDQGDRS